MTASLKNILENISDTMGLAHYYGSKGWDYVDSLDVTTPILYIYPIVKTVSYNENAARVSKFDIQLLFLEPSHLDEDYETAKYIDHIKPMEEIQEEFFGYLNNSSLNIDVKVSEVVNVFNNMDGVAVTGTMSILENQNCAVSFKYTGTYIVCGTTLIVFDLENAGNYFIAGDNVRVFYEGLTATHVIDSIVGDSIIFTNGVCKTEPTEYDNSQIMKI